MKKYWTGVGALVSVLVVILVLSCLPLKEGYREHKPVRVVTSLNFYGEVAQQVAGKYGQVTSVINNASIDPHDYQPSTQQSQLMGKANLVIQNGLGYDHWLTKMTQASGNRDLRVIDVGRQVAGERAGANEHVWYQPNTMKKLAKKLANQYSRMDPGHSGYYHRQARKYLKSLQPLDKEIARVKQGVGQQRAVAVSEPVFDYALNNLGYQVVDNHFAKATEDGNDPSPQDVKDLQDAIINHRIAFFVENAQSDDHVINNMVQLAHKYDVPVLKVTESKPNGKTYQQWMIDQYQELAKIQQKEAR
ncbi:metal ABC transporter solute-binding protein, Zn/Mn family [Limosilactobacillus avium]|uniref:metal ABC transporter solute-binding protein, Zn/Mn family n=1 Tax=Limosilactobacillus avium TaxID=2991831 RepID=UPI0024B9C5BA|nr:zinc ABC transporter substrate-binding protein [Limosilactobacillus avium]